MLLVPLNTRRRGLALVLCFAATVLPHLLKAELVWEQKTVEVKGDAGSPVLEAHFRFTNKGSKPVEIRNVESSCGCTTTALEKRHYEPKEHGEIVAKYTAGTHTGLQKKTILVETDDGKAPVTLTLAAHIQELLKILPTVVSWPHDTATLPKSISLEWMQNAPIDEIKAESSSPDVTVEVVPVAAGRKYSLQVTPKQTGRFLYSKLTISCRAGDLERTFVAFATVQPGSVGQ